RPARLRALPYRRADRGPARRGGIRRAGARHRLLRWLRHRHRRLSRSFRHPDDRGPGAGRGCSPDLARARHRRRDPGRRRRPRCCVLARLGRQSRALSLRRRHRLRRRLAIAGAAARHRHGGLIMYVAVKGGETAIAHSLELLADKRRGDRDLPELSLQQIDQQLGLAVDRVMTEGSCYDRGLAALAIKQASGDLIEAIFLVRAYRTTLPRFGASLPIDTTNMTVERR